VLIEIHGGQFQNKGAEKMLRVTLEELSGRIPDARFVVDEVFGTREDLGKYGLVSLVPRRGWISSPRFGTKLRFQSLFGRILPRISRFSRNSASLREVDALVDISGFAYTDEWGKAPCRSIAVLAEEYSGRRKPVVFLPQAFGPFRIEENRRNFARVVRVADRIYVRDQVSLGHVQEFDSESGKVNLAPDITLFRGARFEPDECGSKMRVLFVPNIRMLRQGSAVWDADYVRILGAMIDKVAATGLAPELLVHDRSGHDMKVAREIQSNCGAQVQIVEESDPWRLKARIGDSLFLVGSRYHALVAAFSTAVPSIALGWSHKYPMLYRDFGQEEFVVSEPDRDLALNVTDQLSNRSVNMERRRVICAQLEQLASTNCAMWDDVASVLRGV
jgi:colanic acid/amylovoran biosynthesis protein